MDMDAGQGDAGEAFGEDEAGARQGRVPAGGVLPAARRRQRPRRAQAHPHGSPAGRPHRIQGQGYL